MTFLTASLMRKSLHYYATLTNRGATGKGRCHLELLLLLLLQLFYGPLSKTTWVSRYQKKHSPTHLSWSSSNVYQLLPSTAIHSILPVQFMCLTIFCITSLQVLLALPLGLKPSNSYSIHFFIQSVSSFHNTCPYHCSLFCCSTIPSLSLSTLYLGLYLLP